MRHCQDCSYFLFSAVTPSCCSQNWIYQPCHGGAATEITANRKSFECWGKQLLADWAVLRNSVQLQPEGIRKLLSRIGYFPRKMYLPCLSWFVVAEDGWMALYAPFLHPALWDGSASIMVVGTTCCNDYITNMHHWAGLLEHVPPSLGCKSGRRAQALYPVHSSISLGKTYKRSLLRLRCHK